MTETRASIPYGTLRQTHPSYDTKRLRELEDLYKGGYDIMRRADEYLVRFPGESDERYEHRKRTATYQPYFGQIVDQFAAELFDQDITIVPASDASKETTPGKDTVDAYYTDFAKNADGQGRSLPDVLKSILTTALKQGRAVLCVDLPAPSEAEPEPTSKAEEDARGLARPYVYEQPLADLIDWEEDDDGNLLWAICYRTEKRRSTPLDSRKATREIFTVWSMPGDKARWDRYEIVWTDRSPTPDDSVTWVAGGDTSFDRIPLHTLTLPDGLWVGNKIGPQALEHFRRRSSLIGAQNDSLYAIPFASLGGEMGAPGGELPAERAQDPSRGDDPVKKFSRLGYLVLGRDEKIDFAEPSGRCYELVDKQLKELRDDMFAVNHQMAASVRTNTTALGRSGLSKQSDKESTAKVLVALGLLVREFALDVYRCIATARRETIEWAAHGLDDFDPVDRQQLLEEAISLDQVQIPSPTFRKLQKFDVARRLAPNATPQEQDVIRKEISDGVDAEEDMRQVELEAKKDAIENPPPPTVVAPTAKPPNGKPPAPPKPPAVQQDGAR